MTDSALGTEGAGVVFRILGPVEAFEGEQRVALGGLQQRALLTILLLHAGETVSTARLIDALWDESAPVSAANSVHVHVSQLRKALGAGILLTRNYGYALAVDPESLDANRFERLVAEGRSARMDGDFEGAVTLLGRAAELWHGRALEEFADRDFARDEAARLEELRLVALEERIDSELALGRASEVVPELEALVRQHPLRERMRGQLMLALYRAGRQAAALDVYRQGRRLLAQELGLEPGPALQGLERAILNHDPTLDATPPRPHAPTPRRGPLLVAASAAVLVLVAAGMALQLRGGREPGLATVAPNSVGVIDLDSGRIVAQVPVGIRPGSVVSGVGSMWVANLDDRSISRLDPGTMTLVRTISTSFVPTGLAVGDERVWVAGSDGSLSWIDPRYNRLTRTPARLESGLFYRTPDHPVAVGFGSIWVSDSIGQIERIEPSTGKVASRIDVGKGARGIAVGAGSVWVANSTDGTVSRVDPTGVVTATIPVGHGPTAVAFGEGSVWIAVSLDGILARIDPETNAVTAVIPAGEHPVAVAAGPGAVLVADDRGGKVVVVDPASDRVARTIALGSSPAALALVNGALWTSVAALAPVHGDPTTAPTLRVEVEGDPGAVDPAVSTNPQIDYATCALLLNYPDRSGPPGAQLVPDVAQSMPVISKDRLRYTFTVRPGFRFSPPSGQPVTAQTFRDTIERALDPRIQSEGAKLLFDVLGAKAYAMGRARHIAGLVVSGDRLTVRLTRPAGDLPWRISEPYFCAVPSGTPVDPDGVRDIPMAGPYYVASYAPGQRLVLRRNPNYGGDRPQGPAEIEYAIGISRVRTVARVRAGQVDYAGDGVPLGLQPALLAEFGPVSAAARGGHQQFFVNPVLASRYIVLNTRRPPFSDARLRRAVGYALDRRALARAWNRYFEAHTTAGGPPTADYLPPGMRISARPVGYPLRPDVAKAKALAGNRRRTAVLFTCDEPPCPQQAAIITANLAAIGIDVIVKAFPVGVMYARAAEPGAAYDMLRVGWSAEYADPAAVLEPLLRSGSALNFSRLDDPEVDRRLDAAAGLTGPARARAYDVLTRWLARAVAPLVAFENDTSRDFFSKTVGCQVFNPVYGMDLAALCVRS